MKAKTLKKRLRSRSGNREGSKTSPAESGERKPNEKGKEMQRKPALKSSNASSQGHQVKHVKFNSIDDYGFLIRPPSKSQEVRVTFSPHSPRSEVDYFDDSLFDVGYYERSKSDNIPVTLGSISSASNSQRGSICTDMPFDSQDSADPVTENCYVNIDKPNIDPNIDQSRFYEEKSEGHYARLSDLKPEIDKKFDQPKETVHLNFYEQKAAEQRARSRSRNPDERRGRSRSARSSSRPDQPRSRSRGRSASRDIMALYTNSNNSIADVRLKKKPSSPSRLSTQFSRHSTSAIDQCTKQQNQRLNTRPSSLPTCHSAINLNDRKVRDNQRYRGKNVRNSMPTPTLDEDGEEDTCSMTVLEMDVERNYQIEKELLSANSLKPANIKMMMIAPHKPENSWSSKDEASAKAGELVTAIYKQSEWLYVEKQSGTRGFVPYAYTKPVKIPESSKRHTKKPTIDMNASSHYAVVKPVTGILKTSNPSRQRAKRALPKYSVKVRTAADNDSLSSDCSSAFTEDFVYTRMKKPSKPESHADCIVVDTDEISEKLESLNHSEDTGTYCSDSGISDPNSNHGEDLEMLHSPGSTSEEINDSGIQMPASTPRLPNERIISVTTQYLESKNASAAANNSRGNKSAASQGRNRLSGTISDMPLGPLGARLAKLDMNKNQSDSETHKKKNIGSDMKERAKSSNIPSNLRPEIPKDYNGPRVTVVFDYSADNEDDLEVKASDIVTVLNSEDIEWIWVQRRDGKEGFIPREYVIPLEISLRGSRRRVGVAVL